MKPIKIIAENATIIESILHEINGKATAHTYITYENIYSIMLRFNKKLNELRLPDALKQGAKLISISGEKIPNAYKYPRTATQITIEHKSKSYYFTDIQLIKIWQHAGKEAIYVSKEQHRHATKALFSQYNII